MPHPHKVPYRAVMLTALPVEYKTLRSWLTNMREEKHSLGIIYERGTFVYEDISWDVGLVETGVGNVLAAIEADRAFAHFKPDVVFFVGIAGGLKDVKLGDVVVATKVYDYESGKAHETFLVRPDIGRSDYILVQRARAEARKKDWLRLLGRNIPDPPPHVFIAPIVAGQKVVSSTKSTTWQFLRTYYGDALAIEMEGRGFLEAAHAYQATNALVIRGISDLIDEKEQADAAHFQEIAALHAGAFAFTLLTKLGGRSGLSDSQPVISLASGPTQSIAEDQRTPPERKVVQNHEQSWRYNSSQASGTTIRSINDVQGRACLKRGQYALSHKEYRAAKGYLEEAAHHLHEDNFPEECAQIKYLQALTLLDGQLPSLVAETIMLQTEKLLDDAIRLYASYSYMYTLALFKGDCIRNEDSCLRAEVQELRHHANLLRRSLKDEENMQLLGCCQPLLIRAQGS